jgi:hypothetical protein
MAVELVVKLDALGKSRISIQVARPWSSAGPWGSYKTAAVVAVRDAIFRKTSFASIGAARRSSSCRSVDGPSIHRILLGPQ